MSPPWRLEPQQGRTRSGCEIQQRRLRLKRRRKSEYAFALPYVVTSQKVRRLCFRKASRAPAKSFVHGRVLGLCWRGGRARASASSANILYLRVQFRVFNGEQIGEGRLALSIRRCCSLVRWLFPSSRRRGPVITSQPIAGFRYGRALGALSDCALADDHK